MSENVVIREPYELSVWLDELIPEQESTWDGGSGTVLEHYEERKIAIIGANDMDTPFAAHNPNLVLNVNGSVTLTFEMFYRCFDEWYGVEGEFRDNPYTSLLNNEAKVKFKFRDEWYDLLIKKVEENSENYTFKYTTSSFFINELSKNGFKVELDVELENNQGTVTDLALKIMKETDWIVDVENSDILVQTITEPIYAGFLSKDIRVEKVADYMPDPKQKDTVEDISIIHRGERVYFFYSDLQTETPQPLILYRPLAHIEVNDNNREYAKKIAEDSSYYYAITNGENVITDYYYEDYMVDLNKDVITNAFNYRIIDIINDDNETPDTIESNEISENMESQEPIENINFSVTYHGEDGKTPIPDIVQDTLQSEPESYEEYIYNKLRESFDYHFGLNSNRIKNGFLNTGFWVYPEVRPSDNGAKFYEILIFLIKFFNILEVFNQEQVENYLSYKNTGDEDDVVRTAKENINNAINIFFENDENKNVDHFISLYKSLLGSQNRDSVYYNSGLMDNGWSVDRSRRVVFLCLFYTKILSEITKKDLYSIYNDLFRQFCEEINFNNGNDKKPLFHTIISENDIINSYAEYEDQTSPAIYTQIGDVWFRQAVDDTILFAPSNNFRGKKVIRSPRSTYDVNLEWPVTIYTRSDEYLNSLIDLNDIDREFEPNKYGYYVKIGGRYIFDKDYDPQYSDLTRYSKKEYYGYIHTEDYSPNLAQNYLANSYDYANIDTGWVFDGTPSTQDDLANGKVSSEEDGAFTGQIYYLNSMNFQLDPSVETAATSVLEMRLKNLQNERFYKDSTGKYFKSISHHLASNLELIDNLILNNFVKIETTGEGTEQETYYRLFSTDDEELGQSQQFITTVDYIEFDSAAVESLRQNYIEAIKASRDDPQSDTYESYKDKTDEEIEIICDRIISDQRYSKSPRVAINTGVAANRDTIKTLNKGEQYIFAISLGRYKEGEQPPEYKKDSINYGATPPDARYRFVPEDEGDSISFDSSVAEVFEIAEKYPLNYVPDYWKLSGDGYQAARVRYYNEAKAQYNKAFYNDGADGFLDDVFKRIGGRRNGKWYKGAWNNGTIGYRTTYRILMTELLTQKSTWEDIAKQAMVAYISKEGVTFEAYQNNVSNPMGLKIAEVFGINEKVAIKGLNLSDDNGIEIELTHIPSDDLDDEERGRLSEVEEMLATGQNRLRVKKGLIWYDNGRKNFAKYSPGCYEEDLGVELTIPKSFSSYNGENLNNTQPYRYPNYSDEQTNRMIEVMRQFMKTHQNMTFNDLFDGDSIKSQYKKELKKAIRKAIRQLWWDVESPSREKNATYEYTLMAPVKAFLNHGGKVYQQWEQWWNTYADAKATEEALTHKANFDLINVCVPVTNYNSNAFQVNFELDGSTLTKRLELIKFDDSYIMSDVLTTSSLVGGLKGKLETHLIEILKYLQYLKNHSSNSSDADAGYYNKIKSVTKDLIIRRAKKYNIDLATSSVGFNISVTGNNNDNFKTLLNSLLNTEIIANDGDFDNLINASYGVTKVELNRDDSKTIYYFINPFYLKMLINENIILGPAGKTNYLKKKYKYNYLSTDFKVYLEQYFQQQGNDYGTNSFNKEIENSFNSHFNEQGFTNDLRKQYYEFIVAFENYGGLSNNQFAADYIFLFQRFLEAQSGTLLTDEVIEKYRNNFDKQLNFLPYTQVGEVITYKSFEQEWPCSDEFIKEVRIRKAEADKQNLATYTYIHHGGTFDVFLDDEQNIIPIDKDENNKVIIPDNATGAMIPVSELIAATQRDLYVKEIKYVADSELTLELQNEYPILKDYMVAAKSKKLKVKYEGKDYDIDRYWNLQAEKFNALLQDASEENKLVQVERYIKILCQDILSKTLCRPVEYFRGFEDEYDGDPELWMGIPNMDENKGGSYYLNDSNVEDGNYIEGSRVFFHENTNGQYDVDYKAGYFRPFDEEKDRIYVGDDFVDRYIYDSSYELVPCFDGEVFYYPGYTKTGEWNPPEWILTADENNEGSVFGHKLRETTYQPCYFKRHFDDDNGEQLLSVRQMRKGKYVMTSDLESVLSDSFGRARIAINSWLKKVTTKLELVEELVQQSMLKFLYNITYKTQENSTWTWLINDNWWNRHFNRDNINSYINKVEGKIEELKSRVEEEIYETTIKTYKDHQIDFVLVDAEGDYEKFKTGTIEQGTSRLFQTVENGAIDKNTYHGYYFKTRDNYLTGTVDDDENTKTAKSTGITNILGGIVKSDLTVNTELTLDTVVKEELNLLSEFMQNSLKGTSVAQYIYGNIVGTQYEESFLCAYKKILASFYYKDNGVYNYRKTIHLNGRAPSLSNVSLDEYFDGSYTRNDNNTVTLYGLDYRDDNQSVQDCINYLMENEQQNRFAFNVHTLSYLKNKIGWHKRNKTIDITKPNVIYYSALYCAVACIKNLGFDNLKNMFDVAFGYVENGAVIQQNVIYTYSNVFKWKINSDIFDTDQDIEVPIIPFTRYKAWLFTNWFKPRYDIVPPLASKRLGDSNNYYHLYNNKNDCRKQTYVFVPRDEVNIDYINMNINNINDNSEAIKTILVDYDVETTTFPTREEELRNSNAVFGDLLAWGYKQIQNTKRFFRKLARKDTSDIDSQGYHQIATETVGEIIDNNVTLVKTIYSDTEKSYWVKDNHDDYYTAIKDDQWAVTRFEPYFSAIGQKTKGDEICYYYDAVRNYFRPYKPKTDASWTLFDLKIGPTTPVFQFTRNDNGNWMYFATNDWYIPINKDRFTTPKRYKKVRDFDNGGYVLDNGNFVNFDGYMAARTKTFKLDYDNLEVSFCDTYNFDATNFAVDLTKANVPNGVTAATYDENKKKYLYFDCSKTDDEENFGYFDTTVVTDSIIDDKKTFERWVYWKAEVQENFSLTENLVNPIGMVFSSKADKDYAFIGTQLFKYYPYYTDLTYQKTEVNKEDSNEPEFAEDFVVKKMVIPGEIVDTDELSYQSYYIYDPVEMNDVDNITYEYVGPEPFDNGWAYDYDEKCQKIRSIKGKESNYFNLLQTLCETFECWVDFQVEHDSNTGQIVYRNTPIYIEKVKDEEGNYIDTPIEEEDETKSLIQSMELTTQKYPYNCIEEIPIEVKKDFITLKDDLCDSDIPEEEKPYTVAGYYDKFVQNYEGTYVQTSYDVTKYEEVENIEDHAAMDRYSHLKKTDKQIEFEKRQKAIAFFEDEANAEKYFTKKYVRVPQKKIVFKEYVGKDNYAGFKYGVNLKSTKRNIDSAQFTSRIVVKPNNNKYAENKFCSIQRAQDNFLKENFFYNFDYYVQHGLLKNTDLINDLYSDNDKHLGYFTKLHFLNQDLDILATRLADLMISIDKLEADYQTAALGRQSATEEIQKLINLIQGNYDTYGQLIDSPWTFNKSKQYVERAEKGVTTLAHDYDATFYINGIATTSTLHIPTTMLTVDYPKYNETLRTWFDEMDVYQNKYTAYYNAELKYKKQLDDRKAEKKRLEDLRDIIVKKKTELNELFYHKYSRYIQEGSWTSNEYLDDNLYFLDALSVLRNSAFPKVSYQIGVVDLYPLEDYQVFDFRIGDRTYVEDTEFFGYVDSTGRPAQEEIVVTEISFFPEDPIKNAIKVQNYRTQFEDLFKRITAQSQQMKFSESNYGASSTSLLGGGAGLIGGNLVTNSGVTDIPNVTIENGKITLGKDGVELLLDGDSISFRRGDRVIQVASVRGTSADQLVGQLNLDTLIMGSSGSPGLKLDRLGLSAYAIQDDGTVNYGKFVRHDQYGLYGIDMGITTRTINDTFTGGIDEIEDQASFALTWNGFMLRSGNRNNRVKIGTNTDIRMQVTEGSNWKDRLIIGRMIGKNNEEYYGFRILNNNNEIVMETEPDGELYLKRKLRIANFSPTYAAVDTDTLIQQENADGGTDYIDPNPDARNLESRVNLGIVELFRRNILPDTEGSITTYTKENTIPNDYDSATYLTKVLSIAANMGTLDNNRAFEQFRDDQVREYYTYVPYMPTVNDTTPLYIYNKRMGYQPYVAKNPLDTGKWEVFESSESNESSEEIREPTEIQLYKRVEQTGLLAQNETFALFDNGCLVAKNAFIEGNIRATTGKIGHFIVEKKGVFIGEDKNNRIEFPIDSQIIQGINNGQVQWSLKPNMATFKNVTIQGKLQTAIFEKGKVQTIGGIFLALQSNYIVNVEIIDRENHIIELEFDTNEELNINNGDLYQLISEAKKYDGTSTGNEFCWLKAIENSKPKSYKCQFLSYIDISYFENKFSNSNKGILIYWGEKNNNFAIGINSTDNGSFLKPRGLSMISQDFSELETKGTSSLTTRLYLGDLSKVQEEIGNSLVASGYGLYADNVFLKGYMYSQNGNITAGINTGNNNFLDYENKQIVFWGGKDSYNNKSRFPFYVTVDGKLVAEKAIISGTLYTPEIIGTDDLSSNEYSLTLRARNGKAFKFCEQTVDEVKDYFILERSKVNINIKEINFSQSTILNFGSSKTDNIKFNQNMISYNSNYYERKYVTTPNCIKLYIIEKE